MAAILAQFSNFGNFQNIVGLSKFKIFSLLHYTNCEIYSVIKNKIGVRCTLKDNPSEGSIPRIVPDRKYPKLRIIPDS